MTFESILILIVIIVIFNIYLSLLITDSYWDSGKSLTMNNFCIYTKLYIMRNFSFSHSVSKHLLYMDFFGRASNYAQYPFNPLPDDKF